MLNNINSFPKGGRRQALIWVADLNVLVSDLHITSNILLDGRSTLPLRMRLADVLMILAHLQHHIDFI